MRAASSIVPGRVLRWGLSAALTLLAVRAVLAAGPLPARRLHAPQTGAVAARAVPALIARCVRHANPALRGLTALRRVCPQADQAIDALAVHSLLPKGWQAQIRPQQLADLAALRARYASPPPRRLPGFPSLRTIARRLQPPPVLSSWWDRMRTRIDRWLARHRQWTGWLGDLPHWRTTTGLQHALLALLIGLVLTGVAVLMAVELRAAGRLGANRSRLRRRFGAGRNASGGQIGSFTAFDLTTARERPVLLLRLLVEALRRSHRLEGDGALTCRELIARAHFDHADQRERFSRVALLAEQALYSGDPAPPAVPVELVAGTRHLYGEILAAPAVSPGS